jgi:hypothetical protein
MQRGRLGKGRAQLGSLGALRKLADAHVATRHDKDGARHEDVIVPGVKAHHALAVRGC